MDSRKKDVLKEFLAGGLLGIALGLGGFFLVEIPRTHAMGIVVFLLLPIAAGFAATMVSHKLERAAAAAVFAMVGSLALLIAMRLETPLCAVLVFPFLSVGLMMGVGVGYFLQRIVAKRGGNNVTFTSAALLTMPLLIFAGHRVEVATLTQPRHEVVTSTVRLAANPTQVWDDLRSFDSLAGEKPLLMYVGLPIPIKCVMEGSGQGAKRTCYFNHGYIQETVIEWSPPNVMLLSIDRTNMPGRHWLGFEYARYELRSDGRETVLTRTTAIISNLYPAWYWRTFERWGVRSEHEYIFNDLARRLSPSSPVH